MSQAILQMIQRGAYPQALAALPDFRALRHDPERLYLRTIAHAAVGQGAEAVLCAERGIELEAELPRFRLLLASIVSNDDPVRAQALYTEVIALNPNLPEGHAGLAAIAAQRGHVEQAESLYRTALRASPDHVPTLLGYGRLHADQRSFDEALRLANKVLSRDPTHADAQALAGFALFGKGSDDFARRALDNALAINPGHPLALRTSAQLYYRQNAYDQAFAHAARLLTITPDDQATMLLAVELLLRSGEEAHAQQLLERLVERNPRHERAVLKLADLEANSNPLAAAARLRATARLLPDSPRLWAGQIALLGGQARMDEALAEAQLWTRMAPAEPQAWSQRATLAEFAGQQDEALDAARQGLNLAPGAIDPSLVLARADLAAGRAADGVARLQPLRTQVEGIKRHELERFLGRLLLAAEQPAEALAAFQAAAEAGTLDPYPPALERTVRRPTELPAVAAEGIVAQPPPLWFFVGAQGSGADAVGRFFAAQPDLYLLTDRFSAHPRQDLITERSRWGSLAAGQRLQHARSRYWRYLERLRLPPHLTVVDWLPQLDVRMYDVLRHLFPHARFVLVQRDPRDALVQAIVAASGGPQFADPGRLADAIGAQHRHLAQVMTTKGATAVQSLGFEDLQRDAETALKRLALMLGREGWKLPGALARQLVERGGVPRYLPSGCWQQFRELLAAALARLS